MQFARRREICYSKHMTKDEELEHLRAENTLLREELAEVKEHLRKLQDQLSKDSHNSGLPPSSDRFARQPPKSLRKKSDKKKGAQPGHPGHHLQMVKEADRVQVHSVEACRWCSHDLTGIAERRQVVELPVKRTQVIEHQVEEKCCPRCFCRTRASFPEGVKAPIQYGTSIRALAVYLVCYQLLPFARASQMLGDLLGVGVSAGTIQSLIGQTHQQLDDVETQIKAALSQAKVIHQDETGIYVNGKQQWVHVCSTKTLTHYGFHGKRGQEAMDAIGIAPAFHGTSVHDGLLSYQKYDYTHAACNVHYLRDLTFVEEEYKQPWARKMKDCLLGTKRLVEQEREAGRMALDAKMQARIRFHYTTLVTDGFLNNPATKQQPRGPGRNREHPARKLLHRLHTYQDQILRFMRDFAVPFDNNLAERDLRMLKVQQKISGGFRNDDGTTRFCRIRSYLSTLRKQGLPLLEALEQTLLGHPLLPVFSPSF